MSRILIIDDDPSTVELIEAYFSELGHAMDSASGGRAGIERLMRNDYDLILLDLLMRGTSGYDVLKWKQASEAKRGVPVIIISGVADQDQIRELQKRYPVKDYVTKPFSLKELTQRIEAILHLKNKVACIGGGSGLYVLLMGLKNLADVQLTSIVTMSDDGGSTGRLREAFGVLPPGDLRRSLVALSEAPEVMNKLIQYRFAKPEGLSGHSFGNLLLTVLSEVTGSMVEAVRVSSEILNISGVILPVTARPNTLHARLENGEEVVGEAAIDVPGERDPNLKIVELWQEPRVEANPEAVSAILNANHVVIGPGDVFTSIVPNLLAAGMKEAIEHTEAKVIYICNLMTKPGETSRFSASDHIRTIVRYLGGDYLDYVVVSKTEYSKDLLKKYEQKHQEPVSAGHPAALAELTKAKILYEDLTDTRDLARHDSQKLALLVERVIRGQV